MLRALVVALLLANLLFFAWARGWLSPLVAPPHAGEREPERLAAQVHPEALKLLTPQAASAAISEATARCVEAGPFSDAEVGGAEQALARLGIAATAWTRRDVQQPGTWLVYMGRYTDAATMKAKQDELKRLKFSYEELRAPPDLAPALVLSRHDSREAAEAALATGTQHGLRTAKVVALPPPPLQHWLRLPHADAETRTKLLALKPPEFAATFAACAKPAP